MVKMCFVDGKLTCSFNKHALHTHCVPGSLLHLGLRIPVCLTSQSLNLSLADV